MTKREELARLLCKHMNIDPDMKTVGLGSKMKSGREYFLWEYQAENYVNIILDNLKE